MKTNKTIEERLEAAVVDALQRYPDMHPLAREHFVNYLLTGESDGARFDHLMNVVHEPYVWLVSVGTVRSRPRYIDDYAIRACYKETLTNETDD